jgi:hypothetical protein
MAVYFLPDGGEGMIFRGRSIMMLVISAALAAPVFTAAQGIGIGYRIGASFPATWSSNQEYPIMEPGEVARNYRFRLESEPPVPKTGRGTTLHLTILSTDGLPFPPPEESLVHFVTVSRSLEEFHSVEEAEFRETGDGELRGGLFTFPITFRRGGRHVLVISFFGKGFDVRQYFILEVSGPGQRKTSWNFTRRKEVDDLTVSLTHTTPRHQQMYDTTEFKVEVTASGKKVTDLEPYRGSFGHITTFRRHLQSAAHIHANTWKGSSPPRGDVIPRGPGIYFRRYMANGENYRFFVQFQRQGRIYTVPFDVRISWIDWDDGRWGR